MEQFKVYFVKQFPIERITQRSESGWHRQPGHVFNRYGFDEMILEHIDNTFCEPIQITLRSEQEISAGPSGVMRLYALSHKRGWTHIPAIVSALEEPNWLDVSVPVRSKEQFRSYYRLEPADFGFEENGKAYHRNHNPNPEQAADTLVVAPETLNRFIAMLKEYYS